MEGDRFLVSFILVVALNLSVVTCYPTGAPDTDGVCNELMPEHGVDPQTTVAPYEINLDSDNYSAGGTVIVTLSSTDDTTPFKGFALQCKLSSDTAEGSENIGTFTVGTDAQQTCETHGGQTVTHVNNDDKTAVNVTWNAPATDVGSVTFVATFVQEYTIIWTRLLSSELTVSDTVKSSGSSKTSGYYNNVEKSLEKWLSNEKNLKEMIAGSKNLINKYGLLNDKNNNEE